MNIPTMSGCGIYTYMYLYIHICIYIYIDIDINTCTVYSDHCNIKLGYYGEMDRLMPQNAFQKMLDDKKIGP